MSSATQAIPSISLTDASIIKATSSAIKQYAYSNEHQLLFVWFRNQAYVYYKVSIGVYSDLQQSASKGSYIQSNVVSGGYKYSTLEEDDGVKCYYLKDESGNTYRINYPVPAPIKPKWASGLLNFNHDLAIA